MRGVLKTPPDKAAVARLSESPLYNSTMRTTCVATMVQAGHAPNALPQRAEANVNCRILPGHTPAEVRAELIEGVCRSEGRGEAGERCWGVERSG